MNGTQKAALATTLGLALTFSSAQAALFDFSYTLADGDLLAGTLEGALLADNNTIEVDAFQDFVTFNGVPGPVLPFVGSAVAFSSADTYLRPTLTLDGSFMDLMTCENSSCSEGFLFESSGAFGFPLYESGASFGSATDVYAPSNWTVTEVPIPATLWLLMLGGVAMG